MDNDARTDSDTDHPAGSAHTSERFAPAGADRPPTAEDAEAADCAARDVDLEEVAEHYEEMTTLGKNVKGDGEIVPN
jgi:hypothetical protein